MSESSLSLSFRENEPQALSLSSQGLSLVSPLQRKSIKSKTPKTLKTKSSRPVSPLRLQEFGPQMIKDEGDKKSKGEEKNVEALQRRAKQLEEEREVLRARLSDLEEEKATWQKERADLEGRFAERIRILEFEKSEMEAKKQAEEHDRQEMDAVEEKKLAELRKERNEARQEIQSLQVRLTRAEDYLRVSKELSHALQLDKQRQSEEAQAKVQALETQYAALKMASDGAQEAAKAEAKAEIAAAQQQLEEAQAARAQVERQLFQALLLAVKLEAALHPTRALNRLDADLLWADAQAKKLPVGEWGAFLAQALEEEGKALRRAREGGCNDERPTKRRRDLKAQ